MDGLADVYDAYAQPLYSYCGWLVRDPGAAAEALIRTFLAAAAAPPGDLDDPGKLRPWLYATARAECVTLLDAPGETGAVQPGTAPRFPGLDGTSETADDPEAGETERAALRELIGATLAGLDLRAGEVVELSLRHHLSDADLAVVLCLSWDKAQALASRARNQLEKAIGVVLLARTGQQDCPGLAGLLAGWDGQTVTRQMLVQVGRHIEHCPACASHRRGTLRLEALSGLLLLAPLPPDLRASVLSRSAPDPVATAALAGPGLAGAGLAGSGRWSWFRRDHGTVAAGAAGIVWLVAAVCATAVTLAATHPAAALPPRVLVRIGVATTIQPPSPASSSRAPRPRPSPSTLPARFAPPSPTLSPSPSPSKSPSPTPSPSPSPSQSPSPSPSPTPSPSASASTSATASPTASASATVVPASTARPTLVP
jgi:DNA-directed RNA polymerase specialized sigma24 family protein